MSSNPKISIVLPVYNGERYIANAINSVLSQTEDDLELIIVDDASTDRSNEICKSYAESDSRIKLIRNSQNKGLPISLNIGFSQARGKYFTWTSDDNEHRPENLEVLSAFLEKNPSVALVYSDYTTIDENGAIIGYFKAEAPEKIYFHDVVGASFLYRSEIAKKIGGYEPRWILVEDYEYWLRLFEGNEIANLNEDLYLYRMHRASLTSNNRAKITDRHEKVVSHYLSLPKSRRILSSRDRAKIYMIFFFNSYLHESPKFRWHLLWHATNHSFLYVLGGIPKLFFGNNTRQIIKHNLGASHE